MKLLSSLSLLLVALPSVLADKNGQLIYPCTDALGQFDIGCDPLGNYYACRCTSNIFVSTAIQCMLDRDNNIDHVEAAVQEYLSFCKDYGFVSVTFDDMYEMYKKDRAANNFTNLADIKNKTAPLTTPIILDAETLEISIKTYSTFYWELYTGTLFGGIMMAYWGAVIAIGALINLIQHIAPKYIMSFNSPSIIKFRQAFTIPATFGFKHSIPMSTINFFSMATPTRGQSMALLGYLVLIIILNLVKYDLFLPNIYYASYKMQFCRYVADRTGVIAFVHFPALFLFGGRNNILIWATGWSFDTFNVYHRWIARGMAMHAVMHSIAYSALVNYTHSYKSEFSENYWVWGVIATVLACVILGQSMHFLRSRFYEMFLFIHIILAAVFLAACYWHCIELGWLQWLYASWVIWGFDRVVRLVRLFWSGFGKADSKSYPDDIFKMTISYSQRWKYYPGSHIYFHVMRPWKFWESHPFTIYQHPDSSQSDKLVVCGTAKEGITRNIYNDINKASGSKNFTLLLDGPYGHRHNLQHYDTCIFVAGGIGVTAIYAYTADLIAKADMSQHIVFIWVTRHESALKWFSEEIEFLSRCGRCTIQMFITKSDEAVSDAKHSSVQEKNSDLDSYSSPTYSIARGVRPDAYELVSSYVSESNGNTSIMVCGPPTLNDTIRRCAADNLGNAKGRVDYIEEAFSW
jgi:predicted ferric reductase